MKNEFLINFLVVCLMITKVNCARILAVFPTPSISHQVVFRPLTQELARRGHQVTVVTTDPAFGDSDAPANLTEIDVHDISYNYWRNNFKLSEKGWKKDLIYHVRQSGQNFLNVFELQLQNVKFQQVLKENFDLVIVEANAKPAFVFSHIFKAPMILMSSLGAYRGNYDLVGAPTHLFLYPSFIRIRSYNLTFFEKITEIFNYIKLTKLVSELETEINYMLKRNFGPDTPLLEELKSNVDLMFLNIHPILERNQPVPPNVVHLWGLHQNPIKKLPQDLEAYLNNSNKGVVYVSFGSNLRSSMLPQKKVKIILKVLSNLPYNVLLKWDDKGVEEGATNIKVEQWLPQSDVLRHPNIKLFITQGGLQSTDEAINAGVPLLGIPIFADQWYNTENYMRLKIGLQLDMDLLEEGSFSKAIHNIINDDSYRQNIKRLDLLMKDQPEPPLERAVWWVQYVLRHGGARHLRAPAANISWARYYELELVFYILLGLLIIVLVVAYTLYVLYTIVSKKALPKDKSKKI